MGNRNCEAALGASVTVTSEASRRRALPLRAIHPLGFGQGLYRPRFCKMTRKGQGFGGRGGRRGTRLVG
jgi:hypothetical protein